MFHSLFLKYLEIFKQLHLDLVQRAGRLPVRLRVVVKVAGVALEHELWHDWRLEKEIEKKYY